MDIHYCGGKIESVSVLGFNKSECCGEDETAMSSCCHDDSYSIDVDQHNSHHEIFSFQSELFDFVELPSVFQIALRFESPKQVYIEKVIEDPPPKTKTPIYLQNNVLLI